MTHRVLKSHRSKTGAIYICNHENNVPSRLSPLWSCGNSCTWAHDVRFEEPYQLAINIIMKIIKKTWNWI